MTHATESGVASFIGEDDEDVLNRVRYLLSFLPSNNLEDPPAYASDRRSGPRGRGAHPHRADRAKEPYDMHEVIRHVVDDGEFLEVFLLWAMSVDRIRSARRQERRRDREPAEGAWRHARHRREREGVTVRAVLRRVQHPDPHAGRRPASPGEQEYNGIIRHGAKPCTPTRGDRAAHDRDHAQGLRGRLPRPMNSKHLRADVSFAGRPRRSR